MTIPISPVLEKQTLGQRLEALFTKRRRQLQDWEANPPHVFGWGIFSLVCLELSLARQLIRWEGVGPSVIGQVMSIAFFILLMEGVVVRVTREVADYFKKKGNWKSALTFLNIGLVPLLLFLPVGLLIWIAGLSSLFNTLFFLLLILKVLTNWKEAIEISHELSRFQSAFVIYATLCLFALFFIGLVYISLIRFTADFLTAIH